MSRVGKNPVDVPSGVEISIAADAITAKGQNGTLSAPVTGDVKVTFEDGKVTVAPANESKRARMMWGTTRALVSNIVTGVSTGFTRRLEINGVGYRAAVQGNNLQLQLGFSHDVMFPIPDGISIKCEKPTSIEISGANKQIVGQVAAKIRSYRPPEPYKGKGVKYEEETILRKEGKKK